MAPINLVFYGNYQCSECHRIHAIVKAIQQHFDDELCFVFRHFSFTHRHPQARRAAEAAEAAGDQGKFWQMHHLLFEHSAIDEASLIESANKLGLNMTRFRWNFFERVYADRVAQAIEKHNEHRNTAYNLAEAVHLPSVYGRDVELSQLQEWIIKDHCRLISISGIGGIGKTILAAKFIEQSTTKIRTTPFVGEMTAAFDCFRFEAVIWKSLHDAPSLYTVLAQVMSFLSGHEASEQLEADQITVSGLLQQFRQSRCLLVLDNWEALLKSGDRSGVYRAGCEDYGFLLHQVAQTQHQSCVLLTSQETPREVNQADYGTSTTQKLQLSGLSVTAGQALLQSLGRFSGSAATWQTLVECCNGHPLMLKTVARLVQKYMGGNLNEFLLYLQQGSLLTDEICDSLKQQFDRMSQSEQQAVSWLAISPQHQSLKTLQQQFAQSLSAQDLLLIVDSLQRRSLLNLLPNTSSNVQFSLCPMMRNYVSEHLSEEGYALAEPVLV